MKTLKIFFILFASSAICGSRSENNPSAMQQCKVGDKACVANLCNIFFEGSANGIPQYGLVPTNPYQVSDVVVEKGGQSPVNIKIEFKRANITGIHNFHIDKIIGFEKDPRNSKFEMIGSVKRASISGSYKISGKFLLLPISGSGHGDIVFENVKLRSKLVPNIETRDGKDYIPLKKIVIKMEPEKMLVNFENLFNNKELSDNMNAALNANADLLYKELQLSIENVVGDAMLKIFEPLSHTFAYSDIYLKED